MDKETLSHYGWIVILVLILAVLLALATPFGSFIAEGFKATYAGFGMTSDNALGIIIPGAEPHEPNTLYYYQPYKFDFGTGQTAEVVFHKDGAYDIYYNDNGYEFGEIYTDDDSAIYENGTVEFIGGLYDISEDGTQLLFEGNVVATMVPTQIHSLYMGVEYVCEDGIEWEYIVDFNNDGSGTYKEYYQGVEDYKEDYQSGTYEYFDEHFTESCYDEYSGQTNVYRNAIYPDGTKVIIGNTIYKAFGCEHTNTELRDVTDDYTGDTYCKDCNELIEEGRRVRAFAIYSADDNSLRFYKNYDEIVVGEVYKGYTVTNYYTNIETSKLWWNTRPWNDISESIQKVIVEEEIKPAHTHWWFYNLTNCNYFEVDKLNVSKVEDLQHMFANAGKNVTGTFTIKGLENWDLSNVKDVTWMFLDVGYSATTWNIGDLSGWNTSSIEDFFGMFDGAGYTTKTWSVGNIGNWNMSSATSLQQMFSQAARNATSVYVGDLGNWDVSNVTTISSLFNGAAIKCTTWCWGDLSKWDVSNIQYMQSTFQQAGYNIANFELDLSTWDVSNVKNFGWMFQEAGHKSNTWKLNVSNWDLSSAETLAGMFTSAASQNTYKYANSIQLIGVEDWDVSNVTNMNSVFRYFGYNGIYQKSANYLIDVSGWDVSNVTTYTEFENRVENRIITPWE